MRDELKSVFVEHEIADEEVGVQDNDFPILGVDMLGWCWLMHICNEIYKLETPVTEEQCKELMKSTGFEYLGGPDRAANLELPVTSYSGGRKMKVQLCAAQLMNCDVLVLDEPADHLDVDNIRWLEDRKLKIFKVLNGNILIMFVEKYPEKKAYFELSNETMKFVFSEPAPQVILCVTNINFLYPTKNKPIIINVNLTTSQVSRVAVISANGAEKSTAVNVLVSKQLPNSGSIWEAAGLRLAYVAQLVFHHLEKHMQETPTQYTMWRFAGNNDNETIEFKSNEISVNEESALSVKWCIDGVTGSVRPCTDPKGDAKKAKTDEAGVVVPEATVKRWQKMKEKTFVYEVKWHFKPIEANVWVEKDFLIKVSHKKLVEREDERQGAVAGFQTKLLLEIGVEKHLGDFGVDPDSPSHTQINQLSGGMKVKVVLAAAIWQNPHVMILDEPMNYLDHEGLGALVLAINNYKNGDAFDRECIYPPGNRETRTSRFHLKQELESLVRAQVKALEFTGH